MTTSDPLRPLEDLIMNLTQTYRKGAVVTDTVRGDVTVREVFSMPHKSEANPDETLVDVIFMDIGVRTKEAKASKAKIEEALRAYPDQDRLSGGPSYIEIGYVLGSQDLALRLIALGYVAGIWDLITPKVILSKDGHTPVQFMTQDDDKALEMAGQGYVMCGGFRPSAPVSN